MSRIFYEGEVYSNWQECRGCNNSSEMKLVCEGNYSTEDDPYYFIFVYRVLRCLACGAVSIYRYTTRGNSHDDLTYGLRSDGPQVYKEDVVVAPPRGRDHAIPTAIAEVTAQAESVTNVSPRAAFILCRAALEEVCNDRGISSISSSAKGKTKFINLKERLNLLFQQEGMVQELQEIIDGIRDLGNEGAHGQHILFAKNVSTEDATTLLNLLDYVLERLYVDKTRARVAAEQLSQLKQKVLKPKTPASKS